MGSDASAAREAMIRALVDAGSVTTDAVERALRVVAREVFVVAGTPLEQVYDPWSSVAVKRDEDGVVCSSTSAPFIQARMIEQAELRPGATVLEVGSGGYNAALLAEITGPSGRVLSVDIDPEVVTRAAALLRRAGYGERVRVVQADAQDPIPELPGPVDAVVVTAGAWDLTQAWRDQVAARGRVVLPLRMNGVTRSIAFRRDGAAWVSTSAEVCGFVPMQGSGAHAERVFLLPRPAGPPLRVRFDDDPPPEVSTLDGVFAGACSDVASGVVVARDESFAQMYLWFACFLPGFCRLAIEDDTGMAGPGERWFPFGVVAERGVAYLVTRPARHGVEFLARGLGSGAAAAAGALVEQIRAWDQQARHGDAPGFAYWPNGTTACPPPQARTAHLRKPQGVLTISWPSP